MSAADVTASGYELVQRQRARIVEAIDSLARVAASLEMPERVAALEALRERVRSDVFKVVVCGEFNAGKSTVINALLGSKVLPAFAIPTTATINEIKWGERPRAVLHPREVDGVRAAPSEIAVEELAEHVTVGADDGERNRYGRVEVFWPLGLCEDGVEIIDSPGLNDEETRQQITTDYLQEVDAVVFVFTAQQLGSLTELSFIDNVLRPLGHDHLFLVVNRINQIDAEDRPMVVRAGTGRIASKTQLGSDGVFWIDARGALEARIAQDGERLGATGFPGLEQRLERFLARDRGKFKILAPAKEARHTLKELLTRELPQREAMLAQSLESLEQRVAEAQEPLHGLEAERDLILERLSSSIQGIRADVVAAARRFYEEAGTRLPQWAADCQVEASFSLLPGRNEERMEALAAEVATHLERQLQDAFAEWQVQTLQPLLEARVATLAESLNAQAEEFLAQAQAVRVEISGLEGLREGGAVDHQDASALERVVAAGGGLLVAGPGAALMGASGGMQGLVRGLLPQLAIGIVGFMILGPGVLLVGLLLGSGIAQSLLGLDKARDKAKAKIGQQAALELRRMQDARAEEVGAAVEERLGGLRREVAKGLEREIAFVHEEIESVLSAKREGQESVDAQRRWLVDARRELTATSDHLGDVLTELAEQ